MNTIRVIINQRDIRKRICPVALKEGFQIKHDLPGETFAFDVPTLEIAGCIVHALRQRAYVKAAEVLLNRHRTASMNSAKRALRKRVRRYKGGK